MFCMKSKWFFPAWENIEELRSGSQTPALVPGAAPQMEPQGWADPSGLPPCLTTQLSTWHLLLFAAMW